MKKGGRRVRALPDLGNDERILRHDVKAEVKPSIGNRGPLGFHFWSTLSDTSSVPKYRFDTNAEGTARYSVTVSSPCLLPEVTTSLDASARFGFGWHRSSCFFITLTADPKMRSVRSSTVLGAAAYHHRPYRWW